MVSEPRPPSLPTNLRWYRHEPMWEAVAEGRLHGGLRQFDLKVDYTEDFGVNTDLETKVRRLNLDIGGEFERFDSAVGG